MTDQTTVTFAIVCHCGRRFAIDQLDQAREHVASHVEDDLEPPC